MPSIVTSVFSPFRVQLPLSRPVHEKDLCFGAAKLYDLFDQIWNVR